MSETESNRQLSARKVVKLSQWFGVAPGDFPVPLGLDAAVVIPLKKVRFTADASARIPLPQLLDGLAS